MKFKLQIVFVLLGACCLVPSIIRAGMAADRLYQKVEPTVVEVLLDGVHSGSGNFVDPQGRVLTAAHIFRNFDEGIKIKLVSERFGLLDAALLKLSPVNDLALLQVVGADRGFPYLKPAGEIPPVGSRIHLLAAPSYLHSLFNIGYVARDRLDYRFGDYCGCRGYAELLYVVAATDRGSSGGGWVNDEGELLGVQSGWVDRLGVAGQNSGVCMISSPRATADFVASGKAVAKTWLGAVVEELWTQPKGFIDRFPPGSVGLVLHRLLDDGPFKESGIEHEWLISAMNGEPTVFRHLFLDEIRAMKAGDEIVLELIKPDSHEKVERRIVLGELE